MLKGEIIKQDKNFSFVVALINFFGEYVFTLGKQGEGTMELTAFGRFIRKYRIDHNILLKEMAERLGISSAFLSSIETGAKELPSNIEEKLMAAYSFDDYEKSELQEAVDLSRTKLVMPLSNAPLERQIAGAFYRNLTELDEDRKREILTILRGKHIE